MAPLQPFVTKLPIRCRRPNDVKAIKDSLQQNVPAPFYHYGPNRCRTTSARLRDAEQSGVSMDPRSELYNPSSQSSAGESTMECPSSVEDITENANERLCKSFSLEATADKLAVRSPVQMKHAPKLNTITDVDSVAKIPQADPTDESYDNCVDKIMDIISMLDEILPNPGVNDSLDFRASNELQVRHSKAMQTSKQSLLLGAAIAETEPRPGAQFGYPTLLVVFASNLIAVLLTCSASGLTRLKVTADVQIERLLVHYLQVCVSKLEFSYARLLWMTPLVMVSAWGYVCLWMLVHVCNLLALVEPKRIENDGVKG